MKKASETGTLYLLPSSLGPGGEASLSPQVLETARRAEAFIVEHPRTARRFLRAIGFSGDFDALDMLVYDKNTPPEDIPALLEPLLAGKDTVLITEAGCPGIADPGASLVRAAHDRGIRVVPVSGPSSVFLALMASGLNGQQFAFHGYLPVKKPGRLRAIRQLEEKSRAGVTQIFMETPYRNNALLRDLLDTCRAETLLCIAVDLTLPTEQVMTQSIGRWRQAPPDLHKRPAIFCIGQ